MTLRHVDALVIGAGQGGGPLAGALAAAGHETVLVERAHVGGTCINEGCTPTKTMVASARVAYLARRAREFGVDTGDVRVDLGVVRQRKRAIVDSFRSGSERRVRHAGAELVCAEASFVDEHTVALRSGAANGRHLSADRIFINTGARPTRPELAGLDDVWALDSTSIMELDAVPEHLVVLGGGYIGLEFAQMFRRFGSRVTIVQRGAQLLGREDPDVAAAVADIIRADGVDVLFEAAPVRVAPRGGGVAVSVAAADAERLVIGSHLLVATGRTPNTDALALQAAGVAMDAHGFIQVNERLETTAPGVWALGDVKGGPAFTHISYDDFRILRTNIIEGGATSTRDRLIPYTVFIDPQLGGVGLTETEARRLGRRIRVATMPMTSVARALEMDESRGFMKAIVDAESGQILGCSVLGVEGGEIMSIVQVAMIGNLPYTALRDGVFSHPTLAESLNNLFSSFRDS